MNGGKRVPATYTFKDLIVAIPVVFLLGVVATTASWRTGVDRTNCAQSDSIYVNAEKYDVIEAGYIQLQAVTRIQTSRIEILESRVDTLYARGLDIQKAIYYELTGHEWEQ